MATGHNTLTTHTALVPESFTLDLIKAVRYEMVAPKTITMKTDWNKKMGQVIHQPRTVNWESATKVPGTDMSFNTYQMPEDELLYIDRFGVAGMSTETFASMFVDESIFKDHLVSMAYALNRDVETTIFNEFQSFSAQPTGSAYNTEVTWEMLTEANEFLQLGGINVDSGDVTLMISIQQESVFKRDTMFMDSNLAGTVGNDNLTKSTLAQKRITGANVVKSPLLRNPAAGGHDMAMYHKKAITLCYASKPQYVEEVRVAPLAKQCAYYQAYGLKRSYQVDESPGSLTLNDDWAVWIPGV